MARLVGVDLPREKRMEIALTYIFGVGRTRAVEALEDVALNVAAIRQRLERLDAQDSSAHQPGEGQGHQCREGRLT